MPKSYNLQELFEEYGFQNPIAAETRASIADLFPITNRCGIYLLEFNTGEYYVGQAIDVTRRYVQHKQTYNDIVKIWFKRVGKYSLDDEERNIIWGLEENDIKLRNIALTAMSPIESDFSLIVSAEKQKLWLNGTLTEGESVRRPDDVEIRRKYQKKFERFLRNPHSLSLIDVLRKYISATIPFPKQSELSFWCVSCFPGYSDPEIKIYSRVNIYWQEVFTVFKNREDIGFSFHLAKRHLQDKFGRKLSGLLGEYKRLDLYNHRYRPGGYDQINLETYSIDTVRSMLDNPEIIYAAKEFNLRLMNKGACNYSRNHCFWLADEIYKPEGGDSEVL